jgi:hypothetical protein
MLDYAAARRSFLLPPIAQARRDASGTGPNNTPPALTIAPGFTFICKPQKKLRA